ncbi:MAG: ABC transporter ATP-binding protein [Rhodospirillales bacterium]|nr:ABC transporter ATP-binding protein [Rhodospirillales bacterium]
MTLLAVERLGVAFGARQVVHDVSFSLDRGETLAIVGESGSGKSLTALSLLGLLPPGAVASGMVRLDGTETLGAPERQLRRLRGGVGGMIFQEPMTSLNPLTRIGEQIAEAMRLHRPITLAAARRRAGELLDEVGFHDAASRLDARPHQLSGGQRQRVMIAMALANDPPLLIADEPTTALDVSVQAQILALLGAEKRARGLALLLITHDLTIVRRHADRVCVMQRGTIVEAGRTDEIFAQPQHPYTRALIEAEPRGRPPPLAADAPVLLEARDLKVHFPIRRGLLRRTVGAVRAVDGISLRLREGETLALVGESGSGKSTAGYALLRLTAASGRVAFAGKDVLSQPKPAMRHLRARMQIVFQDPFGSLSPRLSVGEIVAEGLGVHASGMARAERERRVAAVLAEVGLGEDALHRYPHEFSGGQRQRIAIARAMVLNPSFVVLDEPTSALDMSVQAQIVALLQRLQRDHGLAYLFISHDLRVVRAMAHRVAVMRAGRIVETGTLEAIMGAPQHPYTRALMAAAFGLDGDGPGSA